jgi:hypothetical protein
VISIKSFNGSGQGVIDFGGGGDSAGTALVQSSGKIILVGLGKPPGTSEDDFVATRLDPNGATDATFAGGVVHFDFGSPIVTPRRRRRPTARS